MSTRDQGDVIGASVTLNQYRHLLRRTLRVERELGAVSGAFQEMIEAHFTAWQLTAAEQDVALLSIEEISTIDIAEMRDTRAGTIKALNAAIYRKADVSSRAEPISVDIGCLIAGLDLTA